MVGLVERRLSKSAVWCQRLALFAIPYFIVAIVLHRLEKITSIQLIGLLAFGFVLLIFSILFAIHAFIQLWNEGSKGGKKAIFGLLASITMLIPFLIFAIFAVRYPAINDISTNINSPPNYGSKTLDMRRSENVTEDNNVEFDFDDEEKELIKSNYPKISSRRYPAGPERVFKAVNLIVEDRGWHVSDIRGLEEADSEPSELPQADQKSQGDQAAKTNSSDKEEENTETDNAQDILIDVVHSTLFMSFKNDIVINIIGEEEHTLVEMRSAGRWGIHDFGENARIIEKFMRDLDQNLIGIAGEG